MNVFLNVRVADYTGVCTIGYLGVGVDECASAVTDELNVLLNSKVLLNVQV